MMHISGGMGKLRVRSDHPIAVAFHHGIVKGKPIRSWKYLLLKDDPSALRLVIGTFVYTLGDRVLYFPGGFVTLDTDSPAKRFNGTRLDHLTCDPPVGSKFTSHVAVYGLPKKKSRGLSYSSFPPSGYMFPWFSLVIPNTRGFCILPARLAVEFQAPKSDVLRRFEHLTRELDGYELTPLPPTKGTGPSYIQFDVWIGRGKKWRELQRRPLAWAYKPEIVMYPLVGKQTLTAAQVLFDFGSDLGLAVLVTRPLGTLLGPPRILRPKISGAFLNSVKTEAHEDEYSQ